MSNRLRVSALLAGLLLLALPPELEARERFFGYCITDNTSITKNQRVHNKSCTIRVFDAGTANLSTIFSDNTGTSKSNPFTAASTGFWFFYADDGRYDVQLSLGDPAIGSAFSWGDVLLTDGVKRTIETVVFSTTPTFDASESDVFSMTLTADVTLSTITNPVIGKEITFLLSQDGTGGWTFAFPSDVVLRTGALLISSGVDEVTAISFIYDGANWQEVSYAPDEYGKDLIVNGSVVVNEAGNATDILRVETDTLANAFCTDATNNRIGIGFASTCVPSVRFEVLGGDINFDNNLDSTLTFNLISGLTGAQSVVIQAGTFGAADIGSINFSTTQTFIQGFNGLTFLGTSASGTRISPSQDNDCVLMEGATGGNDLFEVCEVGAFGDGRLTGDMQIDGGLTIGTVLKLADTGTLATSTTPSVAGGNVFSTGTQVGITDFTGGVDGQIIYLLCGADTTTSLTDSTPLFLAGAFTCTADDSITLLFDGAVWTELSRSAN